MKSAPKAQYVVNESGEKSAVLVSLGDYERLLAAWEEVADAEDFSTARKTVRKFISPQELRRKVASKR
ncbi:MAG: hypothetical protein V2A74_09815 [bacterium]